MCILLKEEKMNITIPDEARGFKLAAIRFHDIAVIDMDDRFIREPFADGEKVWFLRFSRNPFIQMPGEPLYGMDLLERSWSRSAISVNRQLPEARMP